jgi:hypothetical protein
LLMEFSSEQRYANAVSDKFQFHQRQDTRCRNKNAKAEYQHTSGTALYHNLGALPVREFTHEFL